MAEFETEYPVNGSNALKPSSDTYSTSAKIIAFPGLANPCSTKGRKGIAGEHEQANAYYQVGSLFTGPLSERKIVRNLKSGSLVGNAYGRISRFEAIAGGVIFAFASFLLFFVI